MTNKIANLNAKLKSEKRTGLVSFIMAGDPDIQATERIIDDLVQSGTDIIEIGMPFSDPVADGKVIQAAAKRALKQNVTLRQILALVTNLRNKYAELPIILMGYFNPIYKFGVEKFCKEAEKSGVTGMIIVDLPLEERITYDQIFTKYNINFINLLSPNSGEDRIKKIVKDAKGFIYYVSVNATTGSKEPVLADIKKKLKVIREYTDLPIAVGFGIKTAKQAAKIAKFSDFIVVGSQYIEIVNDKGQNYSDDLIDFNQELRKAL